MSPTQSPYSRRITLLLEDRDLDGLVTILRDPAQPELRAQAALALGDMQDVDATESLARSTLEDPDPAVKAAARRGLEQLLGNQAQMVIDSYRGGSPETDPWLVEPDEEKIVDDYEGADDEELDPPSVHRINLLLEDDDLNGLVAILRNPSHSDLRASAAEALGELGDEDAAESLVRSTLEDPDPGVQAASRQALEQLLGSQASAEIDTYRSGTPETDPWLVAPDALEGDAAYVTARDDKLDLDGLMRVASHESNTKLRLKAIHMLALSKDMRATDILAYLALRDEKKSIRAAARAALDMRYGSQAEEILKNYQDSLSPAEDEGEDFEDEEGSEEEDSDDELDEDDDEEELEEDEELEDEEEEPEVLNENARIPRSPSEFPRVSSEPTYRGGVVEDAGFPWQTVLLIALVIVIVIAVVLLLKGSL